MNEQTRLRREAHGFGPGGLGGPCADDDAPALVTISHGPYTEQLPVGNITVGEVRRRYRDRFDIDPRSTALVDGSEAGDDTALRPGQMLMFSRRAGEKGR
jgi:hypothetical protein